MNVVETLGETLEQRPETTAPDRAREGPEPVLKVENLRVSFTRHSHTVNAVNGLNYDCMLARPWPSSASPGPENP